MNDEIQMVLLAEYTASEIIELNPQGINIINDFLQGQINFITLEGFHDKQYKISQAFTKSKIRSQSSVDKIFIRPKPIFDNNTNKYNFFIETSLQSEHAKQIFHTLLSLISYVVIIALEEPDSTLYLSTVQTRITDGATQAKYFDAKTKEKMAQILCITGSNNSQPKNEYFKDTTEKLLQRLNKQGVQNQVLSSYPLVKCIECPKSDLEFSSSQLQRNLLQQVEILCVCQRSNTQLMYGPILVQYINNIVKQLNEGGKVNLEKAENEIQIQQAYQAYMSAVDTFHKLSLQEINHFGTPDENQIQSVLNISRKAAYEQFFKKGGSSNMKYKKLLDDYLNNKEQQVKKAYTNQQRDKNLEILKLQSDIILKRIKREGKQKDTQYINEQIHAMKRNYEHQAKGPQKYQLYNDYMKIFTPVAYGYNDQQKVFKKNKQKNMELQRKLLQLKKGRSGCCGGKKCEIM